LLIYLPRLLVSRGFLFIDRGHQMADSQNAPALRDPSDEPTGRSGLEPELGGKLREAQLRTGLEPELGGRFRQNAVYVDEVTCIGCTHCAHVARNTFYIEPDYGRARVICQNGDSAALIKEAIDTCPVDCIHQVDYTELRQLERDRQHQVIPVIGFPADKAVAFSQRRRRQISRQTKRQPPTRQIPS
jgi:ferredoxin